MPKAKAPKKSAPKKQSPDPVGVRVGLPHVPPMYGLKPRKQYLPFSHAEDRLTKSRNYWILHLPPRRPSSLDPRLGILARRSPVLRHIQVLAQGTQPCPERSCVHPSRLRRRRGHSRGHCRGSRPIRHSVRHEVGRRLPCQVQNAAYGHSGSRAVFCPPSSSTRLDRKGFPQQCHSLGIRSRERLNRIGAYPFVHTLSISFSMPLSLPLFTHSGTLAASP